MGKPTVHLICNAHLDPVWQWRWEEGCAETLSTFQVAIDLLKEHPAFIFNHNEAILYRWTKQYRPSLFREIQQMVRKGRWIISGGWFLQPDANLSGTESIIRHILEGRRFFKEYFRAEPEVAYNFDSFGHSGGLPQILQKSGFKMYIHLRPQHPDLILPSDLYRWRGVDGSEVTGYRIAVGLYHTEFGNIEQRLQEGVALALQLNRDVPVFWGIGNHGGGATREDLRLIDDFMARDHPVNIRHSSCDLFYEAVKHLAEEAPLVTGDLQRIFTGCYTSLSRLKRAAQESLHSLLQAETLRSASWWQNQQEYPGRQLEEIWRDHLFNDFHDILPGSCIEPAEKDALQLYGRVLESARQLRLAAAVEFNHFNSPPPALPITILNSNPALTRQPVEVECMISHRPKWKGIWHLRLYDLEGSDIPCQEEQPEARLPFNGWRRKLCFMADVPTIGAAHFRAEAVEGEKPVIEKPPALKFSLDSRDGLIHNLKTDQIPNCLKGGLLKPLVVEDPGDSWGTDCWNYREIAGEFTVDAASIKTIERGPIRTINEMLFYYKNSRLVYHIIAYSELPVLEYRLQIHWNEERKRLKLCVPTAFNAPGVICEIPGGIITRPADGQEYVHSRWLLMKSQDGKNGLAIVNNGQNGFDFKDGEIRLSVLRSAAYCHERGFPLPKYPARKFMDQGVHSVKIFISLDHYNALLNKVSALADWLNMPPVTYAHLPFSAHLSPKDTSADHTGLLRIPERNIRLLTCKQSSDGEALIIRLQETTQTLCQTTIDLPHPGIIINLSFRPLEIKTLRIEKTGHWQEVDMIREK